MVLSVIETEEECKKAPNTLGGVHSLHYINPPKWSKPEAASTTAPAVSTACRSPRAGDSPRDATFTRVQVVIDLPSLLLTQDESSTPAPPPRIREPPINITTPAASKAGHGSMRPRETDRERIKGRQSAATPLEASGHLLRGKGQGTDCPKPVPKLRNMFPPVGVIWVAAGRSGTDGGLRYAPSERTPAHKMPRGARTRSRGPCGPNRVQRTRVRGDGRVYI